MRRFLIAALMLEILLLLTGMFALVAPVARSQDGGDLCLWLKEDGRYEWVDCKALLTPTHTPPTHTPVPSVTPTSTPTHTPAPDMTATPTQETTPPPPTFTVTPEPTKVCALRAGEYNLRVRSGPGTAYEQTALWIAGTESQFDLFELGVTYLWGRHIANDGWSAIAVRSDELIWWVNGTESGLLCTDVEGWPDDYPPPPPIAQQPIIVGLHVTNAERTSLVDFQRAINAAGHPSGVKPYVGIEYCLDALASGNTCTERWPPDCPDRIGGDDPASSAQQYMDARNFAVHNLWSASGFSDSLIIELTNECPMDDLAWWTAWLDAAIDYAERNQWPPIAVLGLGPGHGDEAMFAAFKAPLMRNHDRGGYVSTHNYAPVENCGGDGSLSGGDEWCAFRHRHNYAIVRALGYDVQFLITEASPTDGYQPVTIDTLRDIGKYTCMIKDDVGLAGIYYWNVGTFPPFADANLGPFLVQLAESIAACGDI